jgi:hypothetical protein
LCSPQLISAGANLMKWQKADQRGRDAPSEQGPAHGRREIVSRAGLSSGDLSGNYDRPLRAREDGELCTRRDHGRKPLLCRADSKREDAKGSGLTLTLLSDSFGSAA